MKERVVGGAITASIVGALLILWEVAAAGNGEFKFFFSRPSDVWASLVAAAARGTALTDLAATGIALLLGLSSGLAAAAAIAIVGLQARFVGGAFRVVAAVLAALPILAIAPMFLVWFGAGLSLKVAISALLAGLVFVQVMLQGDRLVAQVLKEFCEANGAKRSAYVAKVLWPATARGLISSFPNAVNAAFLGVFVGEFIAANAGLGYRILQVGRTYQVDAVIAYAVLTVAMLLLAQAIVRLAGEHVLRLIESSSIDPRALRV